ncbi:MAG: FxSxx-COOH system tetratricopeptide repeat protein [Acidimicrobiales bacterium]
MGPYGPVPATGRSLAAGPFPVWNVPHDRHAHFVGRRAELDALVAARRGASGPAPRAITGPPGVGKTQLAVEYAYAHRDDFDVVWWIRAEQTATLRGDLAALGQALGLRAAGRADLEVAARETRAWLGDHDRWLVVADHAAGAGLVRPVLPVGAGGQVLVTSRGGGWAAAAEAVELDALDEDEAVELLLGVTGETDAGPARALSRSLGCHPLALDRAGAYVLQSPGLGLAGYVEVVEARVAEFVAELAPPGRPGDYPASVAITCALAVERVEEQSPVAATLLRACAFLAPESVPLSLFSDVDELPEPLPAGPLAHRDALAVLSRLGLVRNTWRGGIAVDRALQAVVRDRLAGQAHPTSARPGGPLGPWAAGVVRLVERAFPAVGDDVTSRPRCDRLVPHALAAAASDGAAELEPQATSRLLARVGLYLHGRGQLDEARGVLERSLAIVEMAYGPDDPEAGIHLGNLGLVLQDLGELTGARTCLERALDVAQATHGPEHPAVGTFAANLGIVLADLGDLARARQCFERALAIDESAYGPDHPAVASDLNNLGLALWKGGKAPEAYQCFEQARAIDQVAYGADDPSVARDLANMALVRADAGALPGARADLERALAIVESAFGPDHPEVADHLNNLAMVLQDGGDAPAARDCLERALAIAEEAEGPAHPIVADLLGNLGSVLSDLGDGAGARRCFERALAIGEGALGPEHPDIGYLRQNRTRLLRDLGTDG